MHGTHTPIDNIGKLCQKGKRESEREAECLSKRQAGMGGGREMGDIDDGKVALVKGGIHSMAETQV